MANPRVIIQGKLFQKCTHLLYCSALFLCGNVNTRRMSQSDMGSIFYIKKSILCSGQRKLLCELTKFSYFNAFILLGYCCIYSCLQIPPRENWVSICTQSMRNLQLTFLYYYIITMAVHDSQRHPCAQYWHCCALIRNIYCAKSWHYECEFCVQRHLHLHYPIGFRIGKTNIGKCDEFWK